MYSNPKELLIDIMGETEFIESSIKGMEDYTFYQDGTIKRAIARSLEIIGEASNKLNNEFCKQRSSVNWSELIGMRNVVIQHYKVVNYTIAWDVIKNELPGLRESIHNILITL